MDGHVAERLGHPAALLCPERVKDPQLYFPVVLKRHVLLDTHWNIDGVISALVPRSLATRVPAKQGDPPYRFNIGLQ